MQVTAAYPGRAGKERILETYLNLIYYGNGSYGIKAAAANYFGIQNLEEMTVAQAAFLAALPQQPSYLDPYQNQNGEPGSEEAAADAIRERNLVLGAMVEEGYITAAQAREARETTWLEMNPKRLTSVLREPQFGFRVRDEAARILEALGLRGPGGGGAHRRLPHHHDARLRAPAGGEAPRGRVGRDARRLQRQQRRARGGRLDDRRDRLLRRQRRLLQPRGSAGPGPVRRGRPGHPPARVGLQADHLLVGLRVARRDPVDDVRRRDDRVRPDRGDELPADERGHQGARTGTGDRRAPLQPEHPLGPDAVPGRLAGDGELRRVARHRERRLHHGPGSGPHPRARLDPGQPDEHDPGLLDLRERG